MSLYQKVLNLCKKIPKGKVTTYKILAEKLGTRAYRAVGTALRRNKNPIVIPCHRVVNSNGRVGQYNQGQRKKVQLLEQEGVQVHRGRVDLKRFLWR